MLISCELHDYENKDNNLVCTFKDNNIAYSNSNFHTCIGDIDNFAEKILNNNDIARDLNAASHRANDYKCNLVQKKSHRDC